MIKEKKEYLRQIPSVNDLLACDKGKKLSKDYSHGLVVDGIRRITDKLRKKILQSDLEELNKNLININLECILIQVQDYLKEKTTNNLKAVINATGVVVHTNLGRSLLSKSAQQALEDVSNNYSNLEIDLKDGRRGSRYSHVEDILLELTGAEAAMVVNNNAAAVLLVLSVLGAGKEAIISRGELVEIGGSFRIPAVMEQSGTILKEVGCTNKVYLEDYEGAINEDTGLILKVHTSNYRVVGFTEEVELESLVTAANKYDIPVVNDLGSGLLVDLTSWGLNYETTVKDSIEAGVDIVTFSGDKMLGGPQAGVIVGKREYIDKMKKHPLNRAVRVDKFTIATLEATLSEYIDLEKAFKEIPTLNMITRPIEELRENAENLAREFSKEINSNFAVKVKAAKSRIGGGAFPTESLATYVVELTTTKVKVDKVAKELRLQEKPIVTRISNDAIIFDLRTIKKDDFSYLVEAIHNVVCQEG